LLKGPSEDDYSYLGKGRGVKKKKKGFYLCMREKAGLALQGVAWGGGGNKLKEKQKHNVVLNDRWTIFALIEGRDAWKKWKFKGSKFF